MPTIPVSTLSAAQLKVVNRVVTQLKALRDELNVLFPGRKHLVESTIMALAAGENVFVYGPPGTAKSLYMRTFFGSLANFKIFQMVMNSQTPPSHLIGAQILKRLDDGVIDFNVENSLVSCDAGGLDEYGNQNPMTQVSLNMLLHERAFLYGTKYLDANLCFTIVASNLEPKDFGDDPRVKANLDRFMFKALVTDLTERQDKLLMLNGSLNGKSGYKTVTRIEKDDIKEFQRIIKDLNFIGDSLLLSAYLDLVEKLEAELHMNLTDRYITKAIQFMEIVAFMDNQTEVQLDDLIGLETTFVDNSDNKATLAFQKCAADVIKKYQGQIGKQIDAAENTLIDQLTAQLPKITKGSTADEFLKAYRKINDIKKAMEAIKPTLQPTYEKLDKLIAEINKCEQTLKKHAGI